METGNQIKDQNQVEVTQNAEPQEPQTFTQEDVNRIVANRVKKYADYDELREKAAKLDEIEEANKSELQKAQERADSLQAELDSMKKAAEVRDLRDEVAKAKNVPASLLTGSTKEECEAQADQILNFAQNQPGYPSVRDAGEPTKSNVKMATRDQFAEWLNQGGK